MAKSIRKSRYSQRAMTSGKIKKLQRAGLLSDRIDPDTKPSKYVVNQLYKYRGVLSGRQAAVKVSSAAKASELRSRIGEGGTGRVVIVPREKGERFKVSKTDEIKSTRRAYGQTIHKTIGEKFTAPKPGQRLYYTIPRRKRGLGELKRHTFASFDEMLFYLEKYEIDFDDIEQYIEVERFSEGSRRERQFKREYNEAVRKLKNKRKRKPKQHGRK
jgi:hypothetical protein